MEKNFKYILNEIKTLNFHESIFNNIKLPDNIIDLPNIIIYGNQNIGKYYFALNLIKKYSNNNLNIQRRVEIIINKESEYFKKSLLICLADTFWRKSQNLNIKEKILKVDFGY